MKTFLIELLILSRGLTQFVDIYPELVVQHDVSIQVDKPVASSSPVEPGTPLMADDSATRFHDNTYAQSISVAKYFIKLCSIQEEFLPTDITVEDDEEVDEGDETEEAIRKDTKYMLFEFCLFKLLKQCCSCSQEVD